MSSYKKTTTAMMALVIGFGAITATISAPVQAGHAGAFLGGIAVAKIGRNIRDRTEAEQDQAYYTQQNATIAQAQASQQQSPEERIQQLDKLAAGGYITKEEYRTKKQKILNEM
jgi:hypothetical protein